MIMMAGSSCTAQIRKIVVFQMASVRDIKFLAADGVYLVGMADVLKVQNAEHVSVVGKGKMLHVHFFCTCNEGVQLGCSVQKRIVRMYMQVNELTFRGSFRCVRESVNVCHQIPLIRLKYPVTK